MKSCQNLAFARTLYGLLDSTPAAPLFHDFVKTAAAKLSVTSNMTPVRQPMEIEIAISALAGQPPAGLIVQADTFLASNRKLIIEAAAKYRIPAIYPFDFFTTAGGLVSYRPDITEQFRQSANYLDRMLRGEKPADLPVQQPTKF